MNKLLFRKIPVYLQLVITLSMVIIIAASCYLLSSYLFNYKVVAFILLFAVSVLAMFFDIIPVLSGAALSALVWDYFFIPPRFTFHVGSTEDRILLLMYFVIALLNAVLTYKIRQHEKAALQKEEKANTVKLYNTFLNSLSHELRTPIAAIIGATDNLLSNGNRLTDQHKHELTHEISTAALRLNEQVDNLLNMSRLESGFIQPGKNWADISDLVYDVVKKMEENKITQHIHININPAIPLFKLDEGMLERVMYNLLNNACTYTPEKSNITITASCHADVLELMVEDDGNGFPPEEIEQVFDKFYRLKNSKPGGTGLGLSIVKGFTEAMGGHVYLENIRSGGARFTISIPAETSYLKNLKNE